MKKAVLVLFIAVLSSQMLYSAEKYAVLIAGNYHEVNVQETTLWQTKNSAEKVPVEKFWYDTYLMWEMLLLNGYKDENIYVLFASGMDYWKINDHVAERYRPQRIIDDPEFTITDYPSTKRSFINVAGQLERDLTEDDFLFVWTFSRGTYDKSTGKAGLYFIDRLMWDDEFASYMNPISANKKVYWMQQYFSGGFGDDLAEKESGNNVFFNSAAGLTDTYGADDCTEDEILIPYLENEFIDGNVYCHGEFNFHVYSSTVGVSPDFDEFYHDKIRFSLADTNNDGIVSVEESRNWEATYESTPEKPCCSQPGNIGLHTSLEYPTLIYDNYHEYTSFLRGLIAIPKDLIVSSANLVLLPGSYTALLDNIRMEIDSDFDCIIGQNATLKLFSDSEIFSSVDGTLSFSTGSSLVVEGNSRIVGDITMADNVNIDILGNSSLAIQGSQLLMPATTSIKLGENAKLIIENGSDIVLDGMNIELSEGAEIVVWAKASLNATGTIFSYVDGSGKWQGIIAEIGSSVELNNVNIYDAETGVKGVGNYEFNINNSTFEGCINGINLVAMQPDCNYSITYNTLTGIDDGRGVSITSSDGIFRRNVVDHFNIGVAFIMSSPEVAKNEITYNKYWGITISGQNAIPQLIDTEQNSIFRGLNNTLKKNGYVSSTGMLPSSQIGIIPYASVYMRYNGVISSPSRPGISISKRVVIGDHNILISATKNYWGSSQVHDDYFFEEHPHYVIDYTPYLPYPYGYGDMDPSRSTPLGTEGQMLSDAIKLEEKGDYSAANKSYEILLRKHENSPEYYVTMARLPYLYAKAEMDNNNLIRIYDEALGSENITHKKFFKGMKVATHIKGRRFEPAITVAEEMKAEADFEEEIILADINIAIANMFKDAENSSNGRTTKSYFKTFDDLLAKLNESEGEGEKSSIDDEQFTIDGYKLFQNYPNPFNPTTEIKFSLVKTSEVKLNIYNINGQLVSELVNGSKEAGIYTVNFDGNNLNSGMYFYTLEANGMSITKKMVLTK